MPLRRFIGAVEAVSVEPARLRLGQVDVPHQVGAFGQGMRAYSCVAPGESKRHNSTRVACSEKIAKLTPAPSQVAPRGKGRPGSVFIGMLRRRKRRFGLQKGGLSQQPYLLSFRDSPRARNTPQVGMAGHVTSQRFAAGRGSSTASARITGMRFVQAGSQQLIALDPDHSVIRNVVKQAGYDCTIRDEARRLVLEVRPSSPQDNLLLFDASDPANVGWFSRCQFYVDSASQGAANPHRHRKLLRPRRQATAEDSHLRAQGAAGNLPVARPAKRQRAGGLLPALQPPRRAQGNRRCGLRPGRYPAFGGACADGRSPVDTRVIPRSVPSSPTSETAILSEEP